MPIKAEGHAHHLVRRAKAVRGELSFRMICAPAFDYGRAGHTVEAKGGEVLFTSEAADRLALRLRTSLPMRIENGQVIRVTRGFLQRGLTRCGVADELRC